MTGYDASKHNKWLDPRDIDSVTECKVCGERRDVGDMEQYDGGYVCKDCQPDYKPMCDECVKSFPITQIIKVKKRWATYQFCLKCHKELGYENETIS